MRAKVVWIIVLVADAAVGCVTVNEDPDGVDVGSTGSGSGSGSGSSTSANDAPCMQAFDRAKSCFAGKDCASLEPPYNSACEQARTVTYQDFMQALCMLAGGSGTTCTCNVAAATQINSCSWDPTICACVY